MSLNVTRAIDSNGDSDRASLNAITCLASSIPGHLAHAVMTALSSAFEVFLLCNAESAVTTPDLNGVVRARSITVLATEVTGTPLWVAR